MIRGQHGLPTVAPSLPESCWRQIADWVPRRSHVLLLERHEQLTQTLAHEKKCVVTFAGAERADVIISLSGLVTMAGGGPPSSAPAVAIALVAPDDEAVSALPTKLGWRVVENVPVSTLRCTVLESPHLQQLATLASAWQDEAVRPIRLLKYRLLRMLASARRIEKLGRMRLAELDLEKSERRRLLLLQRVG